MSLSGHSLVLTAKPLLQPSPTPRSQRVLLRPRRRRSLLPASCQAAAAGWSPDSWRSKEVALQQPEYPDKAAFESAVKTIESLPPLVLPEEARRLEERLADAAMGRALLLQGGDSLESFEEFSHDSNHTNNIRDTYGVLLEMAAFLTCGFQKPVIKMGRMAGQFAKPSYYDALEEEKDGVVLPSYHGDIVNGASFDEKSRTPNPQRMVRAYCQSASTLALLRAFAIGGYGAVKTVSRLHSPEPPSEFDCWSLKNTCFYDDPLRIMEAIELPVVQPFKMTSEFWTSHDCLVLPYEQALTRQDSATGLYYGCSAHMLWVGEGTGRLDGAHVEFLRGIANPLGLKVGDNMVPEDLVKLVEIFNSDNKPGRITVAVGMGAENIRAKLPYLIRALRRAGKIVTWVSDPMHGNTIQTPTGLMTRALDAILAEVLAFFEVHEQEGSHPGGIHLEMTGQNVTECVGTSSPTVTLDDLGPRYRTRFNPRLNGHQSIKLALDIMKGPFDKFLASTSY